jgi:Rhs element Vgr protein
MAETRTLPIAAGHREFTVRVGGRTLAREQQLIGATVSCSVNKIASARLVFVDGAASTSEFPLADSERFAPGESVEILAGAGDEPVALFVGTVVRVGLRLRDSSGSQFVVDCRHAATRLAAVPRCAEFHGQTDSAIIAAIVDAAGMQAAVETSAVSHRQVVQFNVSDWEFLLARARAAGQLVWCDGAGLTVRRPALDGEVLCTLAYGSTLLEFDGEIDARRQHSAITGSGWDAALQETISVDAASPAFAAPGRSDPAQLAGVSDSELHLRHPAWPEAEAQAWVDGVALGRRVDQVCGRGKCIGIATVRVGGLVQLAGLGRNFDGLAFVTGVRHEFSLVQGWKTHIQFGGVEAAPVVPQPVAPVVVAGLQIGVVSANEDPENEYRIRVRLPLLGLDGDGVWARLVSLDAGDNRGFCFRPEIGDEVMVGFLAGDPRHPVILGMLHSSAKPAPLPGSDDNHEKMYRSRAGMELHFDDDKIALNIATPAGNRIALDEAAGSLSLADQHGNQLVMDSQGIRIESIAALELSSIGDTTLSAANLALQATVDLKLEGGASAELNGGATARLSGGLVQIN